MQTISFTEGEGREALANALRSLATSNDVRDVVTELLAAVAAEGDAAVLRLTRQFDQADVRAEQLRVTKAELEAAVETLTKAQRFAIEAAAASIRDFHEKTVPQPWTALNPHGAEVGERFYPLGRVGLYIPGGQVPLVSTVLMTAIPAMVAGCRSIAVCTPPRADASIDPGLLAALQLIGLDEVYRVGGVQAVGAMAYGTPTIAAVDKLYGPGNAYVMEAKRQLYGIVGVDLLPGPSEVLVIADGSSNPDWVAADLIAQAEHGTGKEKVFLLLTEGATFEPIQRALAEQTPQRTHAEAINKVLETRMVVIHAATLELAAEAANIIAPEHMELQVAEGAVDFLVRHITTAGAILIGHKTPTVLGDFVAGPSHTLPTDTTARFSSGIQVTDFMRRSSVVKYHDTALKEAWPIVKVFAELEQLDAHGESLHLRVTANDN